MNVKSLAYRIAPYIGAAVMCITAKAAWAGGAQDIVTGFKYVQDTGTATSVVVAGLSVAASAAAIKLGGARPMPTLLTAAGGNALFIASPKIGAGYAALFGGGGGGIGIEDLVRLAGF